MAASWNDCDPSLSNLTLDSLRKLGFHTMTPVQGLFSATQTDEVEALVRAGLRNPVKVTVTEKVNKSKYVVGRMSGLLAQKHMVFFSTCACVNYFSKALAKDLFEKGTKAFVSFVQSYRKHECNLIFRIRDLDLGRLAEGFGLLKLPKMPELKGVIIQGFTALDMDYDRIPYEAKIREKQRQVRLQAQKDPKSKHNRKRTSENNDWSKNKDRATNRAKRKARKEFQRKQKHKFDENELDELADEARLVKKLKTGKITDKEFDNVFIGSDESTKCS
ncbi:hypothetical protein QZH41_002130 [Actinostola sp. cb2023]|nr:hypothetical protein QZH41_002130 [Actinostola sp. cb2023]